MLRLVYLYRNLTRNVMRTALTCAAVALPIVIYVLSTAVIDGLDRFLDNAAKQLRLVVSHRASIINPLPSGYRSKIESLDPERTRLRSVCGMGWIGGRIENDSRLLSTLAVQADTFVATFPEFKLTPEELGAWHRDRQAIIVGRATASQFGWKVGDRISIIPSLPPYTPMEFHVISTAPHAADPVTNFCRLDYLDEVRKEAGVPTDIVSFFFVKCANKEALDHFGGAIDELFAHSPDQTRTQDEKAFMTEFITQQFDLPTNLTILAAVTIFVAVMAAANTMSMNFRDRINELAVLRSIGFSGLALAALILCESLLLCGLGGLIGAGIPYVAFNFTRLKELTVPVIQAIIVEPSVCVEAFLVALAVGVVATVWPAIAAVRLSVAAALRNLE